MTIWLIIEQHRAEGESVLSVRVSRPSPEECEQIGRERSTFTPEERAAWCEMRCDEHDVEDYHGDLIDLSVATTRAT